MKDELHADVRPYWSYRGELVVIDGIITQRQAYCHTK